MEHDIMAVNAIAFGLALIAIGVGGYLGTGRTSATALIPAAFGAVLLVLGLVARRGGSARKNAMHVAAAVALLGAIGSLMRPAMKAARGEAVDWASTPVVLQLATGVLCIVFVVLCVRSFIAARRAPAP
jgi:hypothetical protein